MKFKWQEKKKENTCEISEKDKKQDILKKPWSLDHFVSLLPAEAPYFH